MVEGEGGELVALGDPVTFKSFPYSLPERVEPGDLVVVSFNTKNGAALKPGAIDVVATTFARCDVAVLQEYNPKTQKTLVDLVSKMNAISPGRSFAFALSQPGCNADKNNGVPESLVTAERHALIYSETRVSLIGLTTLLGDGVSMLHGVSSAPLAARLRCLSAPS